MVALHMTGKTMTQRCAFLWWVSEEGILRVVQAEANHKCVRHHPQKIGDNSKMHFNIGLIFTALQDHQRAVSQFAFWLHFLIYSFDIKLAAFKRAIKLDPYFAVAYFQRGVSNFALGEWVDAYQDFSLAHKVRSQVTRSAFIQLYHSPLTDLEATR